MNFFKTVFSDESDEPQHSDAADPASPPPSSSAEIGGGGGGEWSFGGLIKTIASRSETVMETYGRDLKEFREGLSKETAALRTAASRAVDVAHDSLESVGHVIDDLGGSVSDLISQIAVENSPEQSTETSHQQKRYYTRFEAQVHALQSDPVTFSSPPEDEVDFGNWSEGFDLKEKEEEIEMLVNENSAIEGIMERLVPSVVDYELFWRRYYYKLNKLKLAEDARVNLVKRVISGEEEELSWEVEDDDDDGKEDEIHRNDEKDAKAEMEKEGNKEEKLEEEEKEVNKEEEEEEEEKEIVKDEKIELEANKDESKLEVVDKAQNELKAEENVKPQVETCKDSDISVVSSQPSMPEEDDMEWDEIEDLGEHEEKNITASGGSPKRIDLRKKLSAAEEDEDLSWDIEDDDEPTKH